MARKDDLLKKKDKLVAKIRKKMVALGYSWALIDIRGFIERAEQK